MTSSQLSTKGWFWMAFSSIFIMQMAFGSYIYYYKSLYNREYTVNRCRSLWIVELLILFDKNIPLFESLPLMVLRKIDRFFCMKLGWTHVNSWHTYINYQISVKTNYMHINVSLHIRPCGNLNSTNDIKKYENFYSYLFGISLWIWIYEQ